jgi:hypothetical protein
MKGISVEKAIEMAKKKGLKPGMVRETGGILFTKGENEGIEILDWDEFKKTISKRKLQIYASGGWVKIMKRKTVKPSSKCKERVSARLDVREALEDIISSPTDEDIIVISQLMESIIINMLCESRIGDKTTLDSLLQLARG